jgi:uncharacterized membrane protein YjdF
MLLLLAQLAILVVLVVLNIWYGLVQGMYDRIWWWDIPAHFLGGVWAGLFAAWYLQRRDKDFTVMRCAALALSIGIVWEIFEWYFGLGTNIFMPYMVDTSKDLVIDTIGGAVAGFAVLLEKNLWRRK